MIVYVFYLEEAGPDLAGERQEAESAVSQAGWTGRLSLYRLIISRHRLTCRDGRFLSPSRRELCQELVRFVD